MTSGELNEELDFGLDSDGDASKLASMLRERREEKLRAQAEVRPETEEVPDGLADWVSDSPYFKSDYDRVVDAAIESITLLEVYETLNKGKYKYPAGRKQGEGIKISCPLPGHTDNDPSAWVRTDKGNGGVGYCAYCAQGFDKFDVAAYAFGFPVPDYKASGSKVFGKLVQMLAFRLRSVVPASATPVVVAEDSPDAKVIPLPVKESEDDLEDDTQFPTYDISKVLPGGNTFLDLYCAEALKDDVPREFPLWAGLAALSVAVGRRVALSKISEATYGNLAVCLTSRSASGKGITMRPVVNLIRKALPYDETPVLSGMMPEGVRVIPLPGSGEALVSDLDVVSGEQHFAPPALVEFEEMQQLIGKSAGNSLFKTFVLQFTDCRREVSRNSLVNGKGKVVDGFVTFLTATQPKHLRSQFSKRDQASGLLNRFVFPFGKAVPRRAWGTPDIDWALPQIQLMGVASWAQALSPNSPDGKEYWIPESDWDDDAREAWIELHTTRIVPDVMGEQSDMLGRMDLNTLRLILLFAVNDRSARILLRHVRSAEALYDYMRECALNLAKQVSATEMSDNMRVFLDAVRKLESKNDKPPTLREIKKSSRPIDNFNQEELAEVIKRLTSAKMLFHIVIKQTTRSREAYTTSLAQWNNAGLTYQMATS